MAETLASDQVTLAKVIDGGDIPEELVQEIHDASTNAAEAKTDAAQAIEDAEDAAKTASSFITTNDNGAFFHPENDPTNSIRIDGDSIDFYQDDKALASIGVGSFAGNNYCQIASTDNYEGVLLKAKKGNSSRFARMMMTTNEDTASIQHYIQGDGGSLQHYYSSKDDTSQDITEVMGITGALARIKTGIKNFKPFHALNIIGNTSEATIEAGIETDETSYINLDANKICFNKQPIDDYVIEHGITNGWQWAKWNSGKYEAERCWNIGQATIGTTLTSYARASGVVEIVQPPHTLVSGYIETNLIGNTTNSGVSLERIGYNQFRLRKDGTTTVVQQNVMIGLRVVAGRWK